MIILNSITKTMAELVIGTVAAVSQYVMAKTVLGVSMSSILPGMIDVSWKTWIGCRRGKVVGKIAKLLYIMSRGRKPTKNQLRMYRKNVRQILKYYPSKTQLIQFYKFIKILQDAMYDCDFTDAYYVENEAFLLRNPEELRIYLLKQMYLKQIKNVLIVKIFNHSPNQDEINKIKNHLSYIISNRDIKLEQVKLFCMKWERALIEDYNIRQDAYDKDFDLEKEICSKMIGSIYQDKAIHYPMKVACKSIIETIEDLDNSIEDNFEIEYSVRLRRTMTIHEDTDEAEVRIMEPDIVERIIETVEDGADKVKERIRQKRLSRRKA